MHRMTSSLIWCVTVTLVGILQGVACSGFPHFLQLERPLFARDTNQDDQDVFIVSRDEQVRGIAAAKIACLEHILYDPHTLGGDHCNRTWDGITCWQDSAVGKEAVQSCPAYVNGLRVAGNVTRRCMPNGEWFVHPFINRTWSNYSDCLPRTKLPAPIKREDAFIVSRDEEVRGIAAAKIACLENIVYDPHTLGGDHCNRTWDGITCWQDSAVGKEAVQSCPAYVNGLRVAGHVTRRCMPNGEWFVHPFHNRTWSNYSDCLPRIESPAPIKREDVFIVSRDEQVRRIAAAKIACLEHILYDPHTLGGDHCNRTWDGWMCWPDSTVGKEAVQSCPAYISGFSVARNVTRRCMPNGEWFVHPFLNRTWSNYTDCVPRTELPVPINREDAFIVSRDEQIRGIAAAKIACLENIVYDPHTLGGDHCNRTWDGWMCWQDSAVGKEAVQSCPAYISGFRVAGNVTRRCMPNGEWFVYPFTNRTWSNYTDCVPRTELPAPINRERTRANPSGHFRL